MNAGSTQFTNTALVTEIASVQDTLGGAGAVTAPAAESAAVIDVPPVVDEVPAAEPVVVIEEPAVVDNSSSETGFLQVEEAVASE